MQRSDSKTTLTINVADVKAGEYELILESYNALSIAQNALKTDKILIKVLEPVLPVFERDLEPLILKLGKDSTWTLPNIVDGTYPLAEIVFQSDKRIDSYIRINRTDREVTFNG